MLGIFFLCMNENSVNPVKRPQRPQLAAPMIDFKQLWSLAVINWKWFVVSVISCVFLAGLYLWFGPKKVSVSGKMEIIDKSKNSNAMSAGVAMLNSMPMGLGSALAGNLGSLGIDAEKEILKSNFLVRHVVKDLSLYTEYRLSKWGRKSLLYQNQPVNVTLDPAHVEWLDTELPVTFHQIRLTILKDEKGYTVKTMLRENKEKTYLPDQTFSSLPATIKTDAGVLTLTENKLLTAKQQKDYIDGYKLIVTINPPSESADAFIKNLTVEPPSKKINNILTISLVDPNVERGIDFVNRLVDAYNQRANDEKNEEARKNEDFVNTRLALVDKELGSSDEELEKYKKQSQITLPQIDAEEVMAKKSEYESQLVSYGTQLQLHDYLSEYVNDPNNLFEFIPLSIGSGSAVASQDASLISQHNSLVNQRKSLLKSMSEKAPQVERITETIKELHPVIQTAMKRDRQSLLMKRSTVEREYSHYMSRVSSTPEKERVLTEIGRERSIKQSVYLMLLQKREETAIELANVTDKGKWIDDVRYVKNSSKPKMKLVLIIALFVSVVLAFFVLYVLDMFRSKIDVLSDLKSLSKNPIIGVIPSANHNEAIRNLRTNLLLRLEADQRVILVVSDLENDGKSFVSRHLTEALQQTGKKALLLNLNLRENVSGIADYLPELKNLYPSDIFAHKEFAQLIEKLKSEYDYLVIDTPAIGQYADAYQIARFADVTCYVVKVGHTSKKAIESLKNDAFLPDVKFVLNAIDMTKRKNKYYFKSTLAMIAFAFFLTACGSSEKIAYVQNLDQIDLESSKLLFDARIMPKDVLTITVSTVNKEASAPFNLTVLSAGSGNVLSTQPALQTYLVDNDGTIDFPIIGSIKVGGLTKKECETLISDKIRPYLAETEKPIVTVRMSSYSIAVLGEVKSPGSFQVSREKINIFEALAKAGDMTIYGVRDRVRLIREDASGKKEIHVLDLTDANIINSPYYYLQQNDMVYVEPSNIKKQDARVGSMTNLWFSATSILVSLASIIVTIAK